MSSTDSHHYVINISLNKEFLKWVHSHKLIDGELGVLWENKPDLQQFNFGGRYGTQFNTIEEVESFNTAFDAMLEKYGIDSSHKHNLFYLLAFLGEDSEQQSIENNRRNHLLNYARFLLNLIADSLAHIQNMRKNELYEEVEDIYTQEIFFAKKEVVASMPYEDLITYVPDHKNADDIVKYVRITIYDGAQLYVPEDLIVTIQSKNNRKLKTLSGAQTDLFELPDNLKREMFSFMVSNMVAFHKQYNTQFYQDLISDNTILSDFKSIDAKFKKHKISYISSLGRVGTLVTDYLLKYKLFTSKRSIAQFLFEYFALFKAIQLRRPAVFPDKYEDLTSFYAQHGVNGETIRNMMKDVGDF